MLYVLFMLVGIGEDWGGLIPVPLNPVERGFTLLNGFDERLVRDKRDQKRRGTKYQRQLLFIFFLNSSLRSCGATDREEGGGAPGPQGAKAEGGVDCSP
jgi:hypothetical protein